jgi:hypothetical protein
MEEKLAMRDVEIREALHERLGSRYGSDPAVRVVDEMAVLSGACRVDIAVINGRLEGLEIKSERDTLERLPRQVELYGRVFDRMTMVCAERHLEKAIEAVPGWWGVEVASRNGVGAVALKRVRAARANRGVEAKAVAQLLWRDEALGALTALGADGGLRSKPRRVLWGALAGALPARELRKLVRERLRARRDWLSGDRRPVGDG